MGAVVDVLLIGKAGILQLQKKYPKAVVRNMTNSNQTTQKYRVIIPDEELEDGYYEYLVDTCMALSSLNFRSRLESDPSFKERMTARAAANREKAESERCANDGWRDSTSDQRGQP